MIHQHPESFSKHFLCALLLQRTRLKALGMKMAKALLFGMCLRKYRAKRLKEPMATLRLTIITDLKKMSL